MGPGLPPHLPTSCAHLRKRLHGSEALSGLTTRAHAHEPCRGTRSSAERTSRGTYPKTPPQNPKKGSMRGGVDDEDDDDGGSDDNGARRRHDLYLHAMLLQCKIKKTWVENR